MKNIAVRATITLSMTKGKQKWVKIDGNSGRIAVLKGFNNYPMVEDGLISLYLRFQHASCKTSHGRSASFAKSVRNISWFWFGSKSSLLSASWKWAVHSHGLIGNGVGEMLVFKKNITATLWSKIFKCCTQCCSPFDEMHDFKWFIAWTMFVIFVGFYNIASLKNETVETSEIAQLSSSWV